MRWYLPGVRVTTFVVGAVNLVAAFGVFGALLLLPSWKFDLGSYILGGVVFGFGGWHLRYWRNRA